MTESRECKFSDGIYNEDDFECQKCAKTSQSLCRLFAHIYEKNRKIIYLIKENDNESDQDVTTELHDI